MLQGAGVDPIKFQKKHGGALEQYGKASKDAHKKLQVLLDKATRGAQQELRLVPKGLTHHDLLVFLSAHIVPLNLAVAAAAALVKKAANTRQVCLDAVRDEEAKLANMAAERRSNSKRTAEDAFGELTLSFMLTAARAHCVEK